MRSSGRVVIPVLAAIGVFVAWDLLVRVFDVKPYIVPSPGAAFGAIANDWDRISELTLVTVRETVLGFLIGALVGFGLAVAMAQSRVVARVLYPLLIASQAIPIVAIAAPLVILLGFGLGPKLVIVALIVFFPVVVNVLDGLASVDRDLLNLARVMGASEWRLFRVVRLPATYTPLFSALKLGATYAVTGAVIGEWTASAESGLGRYLLQQNARLNTAGVYGATLILTAIGIGGFLAMVALEHLATPWRTRATARHYPWQRRLRGGE